MYRRNSRSYIFRYWDFILLDIIVTQIAFLAAYWLRMGFMNPYMDDLYVTVAWAVLGIDLLVVLAGSIFVDVLQRNAIEELKACIKQFILVELFGTALLYFGKVGEDYSRVVVFLMGVFSFLFNYGVRLGYKLYIRKYRKHRSQKSIILMAANEDMTEVIRNFEKNNYDSLTISGLVVLNQNMEGSTIQGYPVIATRVNAAEKILDNWVDEVFIRFPYGDNYPKELITNLTIMGITVHQDVQIAQMVGSRYSFWESKGGYHVLTTTIGAMSGMDALLKRIMDILGGLVGCILTGIIYVIVAPKIKKESPGPVFFAQERIGKNGKRFKMYKFRSMYLDAEERKRELMAENRIKDGMMFKLEFDPRIIGCKKLPDGTIKKGIGNKIRDWSIDEFPQFWNVLKGDMSLVGTRPPTLDEWEKYSYHHRARMSTKPGITGMWQTSGRSNITDFEEVVRLDTEYIANWSLSLDLKLLFRTVKVALKREGSM